MKVRVRVRGRVRVRVRKLLPLQLDLDDGLLDGELLARRRRERADGLLVLVTLTLPLTPTLPRRYTDGLLVLVEAEGDDHVEREVVRVRVEDLAHLLHQTLPMPLAHGGVAQVADERHQLLQVVDALLEALDHLVRG